MIFNTGPVNLPLPESAVEADFCSGAHHDLVKVPMVWVDYKVGLLGNDYGGHLQGKGVAPA